jgi:hypothetical protein
MMQILSHTPAWVFALFLVLLVFGLMQTRTRRVRKLPALLLPAGMVALSLAGIQSSFGLRPVPLLAWATGLVAAAFVGHRWFRDDRVQYHAAEGAFLIPGSWAPLAVIMAIFFAKYAYAVLLALKAQAVTSTLFLVALSAVYGLLSGYFVARGINLVRKARMA